MSLRNMNYCFRNRCNIDMIALVYICLCSQIGNFIHEETMSLHLGTVSRFQANISLLVLLKCCVLSERNSKYQPTETQAGQRSTALDRGKHVGHCTADGGLLSFEVV